MTDRYYLTDGSHVLLAGATGSGAEYGGKSVTANWWYCGSVESGWHDLGVYFDPKGLSFVRRRADASVSSLKGFAEAFRAGKRRIQYRPAYETLETEHVRLREFLRQLPGTKLVVHDEAHEYDDVLGWWLSQAGNLGNSETETTGSIRSLCVTQRPWNLPEELRANMPVKVWVGPLGNEGRRFLQSEQMETAAVEIGANTGQYRWSVTDAGEYVHTNPPVPEKYA